MKLREIICIVFLSISIVAFSFAQESEFLGAKNISSVEWLSFEEVEEKLAKERKKLLVGIYRDGCGWCKKMEEETFKDPVIVDYIKRNFYAVKLNAEGQESITFQGKTYGFVKNGKRGHHELAIEITRGEQGLPATVFLDEDVNIIQSFSGYQSPEEFEKVMTYFGEDHHFTTPWTRYDAIYQPANKRKRLMINSLTAPTGSN